MGLKLTAKCLPRYFERLNEFGTDYRQFEEITFINTETGEKKVFAIARISSLDDAKQAIVRSLTPEVPALLNIAWAPYLSGRVNPHAIVQECFHPPTWTQTHNVKGRVPKLCFSSSTTPALFNFSLDLPENCGKLPTTYVKCKRVGRKEKTGQVGLEPTTERLVTASSNPIEVLAHFKSPLKSYTKPTLLPNKPYGDRRRAYSFSSEPSGNVIRKALGMKPGDIIKFKISYPEQHG